MSRYNLIDEPWIPVRNLKGERLELGIRDVLLKAKEIAAIEDSSPLVTAALHRFLLAVLYRALMGPIDIDQARELICKGIPAGSINAYLDKWRGRFYLFDDKYPFGQIPDFTPQYYRSWTALAAEHNADNAKVLFDHIDVEDSGSIAPASAIRWLLATLTFSVSAGKSELSHTGTAPSATAAMVLPLGGNLSDTLLFMMVPQNREVMKADSTLWERDPEKVKILQSGPKRRSSGVADRYTWRTRSVRLVEDDAGCVRRLAFASGVGFEEVGVPDPMLGYRDDEKRGRLPIQFRERGLWRDFDSLLPSQSGMCPLVVENAIRLSQAAPKRFPSSVMVLGQRNDKAKIEFWRMERFALPEALQVKREIRSDIRRLLDEAETAQKSLWSACATFARHLLRRGNQEPHKDDVSDFVNGMPSIGSYWNELEGRFHEMLGAYGGDRPFDDVERGWLVSVRDALRNAWQSHRTSESLGDVWAIRALAKAEGRVLGKIGELDKRIRREKEVV